MTIRAGRLYLIIAFWSSLALSTVFTLNLVYHVTVVGLDPLQLVLVGTVLEASAFLFELPTGILADLKGRRMSVVLGYALIGAGFVLAGSVPRFGAILAAQVIWGCGYTFTSGALQAWISDEQGVEEAGRSFARAAQWRQIGGLAGIGASMALGVIAIPAAVVGGGVLALSLALALAIVMPENGFTPHPEAAHGAWRTLASTVRSSVALARRRPVVLRLLAVTLFFGLSSEGLDRLWTAHMLRDFDTIVASGLTPAVWFAAFAAGFRIVNTGSTALASRIAVSRWPGAPVAALAVSAAATTVLLAVFAIAAGFWVALAAYALTAALRRAGEPLFEGLLNREIDDSRVRATVFSAAGQTDAIGQVAGGPVSGAIGRARSLRAGLLVTAALLAPAVPLLTGLERRQGAAAPTAPHEPPAP